MQILHMILRNPFSDAREDDFYSSFDDMMEARDPKTGETWSDYAIRTGMSAKTLIEMWERQRQGRAEAIARKALRHLSI